MSNQSFGWMMPMMLVSLLCVPAAGQSPQGPGSPPMAPYGQLAGCSEEPAQFHRCALAKAKGFDPPRTPDGKPDFRGFWSRGVARGTDDIEEHGSGLGDSGVERWTMFDANAIHYEATIDDPKVYTRPWTIVSALRRNTDPRYELWESACHEGSINTSRTEIGLKYYFGVTPPK